MTTATRTANPSTQTDALDVRPFRVEQGCVAYLVIDRASNEAMVVDPRLDQVDELLEAATAAGATVRFVLDTHTHADHLSGVVRLAKLARITPLAHSGAELPVAAERLADGQRLPLGESTVEVVHTPGHTADSLSLVVNGHLFTGDALFVKGAGRTDFPGGSASALFDSFRRYEELPDATVVHPGHDYAHDVESTIGAEKTQNTLLAESDRDALVERLDISGPHPTDMRTILTYNKSGPDWKAVSPIELESLRTQRDAVAMLDVRSRSEFVNERLDGATHLPLDELSKRLGEVPTGGDLVLVCRSGVRAGEAARILAGAGMPGRVLEGGLLAWRQSGRPVIGRSRVSVERQTQLTIGSVVATTVALGAFLSPWFLIIPAFMGLGLMYAGASGTCALGAMISKMPWNREPADAGAPVTACAVGGGAPTSCAVGGASDVAPDGGGTCAGS